MDIRNKNELRRRIDAFLREYTHEEYIINEEFCKDTMRMMEDFIGHAPGGVCPFGIKEGIPVYLDESLKKFDTVYPAAGNDHSAVRLTIAELEAVAGAEKWVDVCKE